MNMPTTARAPAPNLTARPLRRKRRLHPRKPPPLPIRVRQRLVRIRHRTQSLHPRPILSDILVNRHAKW